VKSIAYLVLSCLPVSGFSATNAATNAPFFRPPKAHVAERPFESSSPVVVNAASYEPGVSPGTLATIFGQNLSDVSGVVGAGVIPLPLQLAGVTILVNGIPAPILYVAYANGEDQISFQVPFETPTGPRAAEVQVLLHNFQVADVFTDSFTEDPGIFMYDGAYAVAVLASNYELIGPNNPALPGDVIILYATGLGPVTVNVPTFISAGLYRPYPLAYTADPSQVLIEGEPCVVYFSGLAPGFVGLYQINLRVPYDAPRGNLDIQIQTPYTSSALAKLPLD
jgi:minor extracellular serine protease Vpr